MPPTSFPSESPTSGYNEDECCHVYYPARYEARCNLLSSESQEDAFGMMKILFVQRLRQLNLVMTHFVLKREKEEKHFVRQLMNMLCVFVQTVSGNVHDLKKKEKKKNGLICVTFDN